MTNEERIKADARKAYPISWQYQERIGYIAGATAENGMAQKRIQELIDVFKKIVHAPVPANEREYMAWFVAVKNIAGGVISEWEADNEIEQWKGKEVKGAEPTTSKCGMCGHEGFNHYIGNQYYLCEDCMRKPENI